MDRSLTPSFGANAPFGIPLARVGEVIHPKCPELLRVESELSGWRRALQMSVGVAAAAGTIVALFARSGVGL